MLRSLHWKLIPSLSWGIPANMRAQIPFGFAFGSNLSHLLGFLWRTDTPCQMWAAAKLSTAQFRGVGGGALRNDHPYDMWINLTNRFWSVWIKNVWFDVTQWRQKDESNVKILSKETTLLSTHAIHIIPGQPPCAVWKDPLQIYVNCNTSQRRHTEYRPGGNEMAV